MAYCLIVDNPEAGREEWAKIVTHVRGSGPFPPAGQRLLIAGPAESGWRVISVWDAPEARATFEAERLGPALRDAGVPVDGMTATTFEVDTLVAADLTGVPAR